MQPVLISPVNVSEGRRAEVVRQIADAAGRFCFLLDVHADADHNRSVLTLAGQPGPLVEGIIAAAKSAMGLIDLRKHHGVHPRFGATDVVPFVADPRHSSSSEVTKEAVSASVQCALRIWTELRIPCFLYEGAAGGEAAAPLALPVLRKEAFASRRPDFGDPEPHPTAGAIAVGARPLLVAYNIDLDSTSVATSRRIAADLRRRFESVRALGLPLASRGCVQVSCNLLRPEQVTMSDVFDAVNELASAHNVGILRSEVAGLASRRSLGRHTAAALRFSMEPKILEDCLQNLA